MTSTRFTALAVSLLLVLARGLATAQPQPQPQPPSGERKDAKSLMQSGLRLFELEDYRGALALFEEAYALVPSEKILLNIGTTLKLLDRKADAANAYQRYLDHPEASAAKKTEVTAVLADLDRAVGQLLIDVTPTDAEVQINDGPWQPAASVKRYRVDQGQFTVTARKDKHQTEAKSAQIIGGEKAAIVIALAPLPEDAIAAVRPTTTTAITPTSDNPSTVLHGTPAEPAGRSRIGVLALAHLDVPRGAAVLIGATADVTGPLQLHAAAIIGPTATERVTLSGVYAGASFAFVTGDLRPIASLGFPVFFSDGARFAIRGAGGIEYQLNRHLALIAELGLEHVFNPEQGIKKSIFVPAIGASGRL